jgi:beta-aspartyl-peptidase (threonine type)
LFNAGCGAVFTLDGHNELDASIMDGSTLRAGAVCGVTHIKKPDLPGPRRHGAFRLRAAQRRRRRRVRLSHGFEFVPRSYFYTSARWQQLERIRGGDTSLSALTISHVGTVGAVALDTYGRAGGRHVDRRNDGQALRPHRGLADHRRRNLRG